MQVRPVRSGGEGVRGNLERERCRSIARRVCIPQTLDPL